MLCEGPRQVAAVHLCLCRTPTSMLYRAVASRFSASCTLATTATAPSEEGSELLATRAAWGMGSWEGGVTRG